MRIFRPLTLGLLPLAIPLFALGASAPQIKHTGSPLIDKVRIATERFKDINVAIAEGFVQGTPCVSGPDTGAMGVHFVLPSRIAGGVLQARARGFDLRAAAGRGFAPRRR
jgi:hypothetical protein